VRSLQPISGNPWPHDMVLTISNDDGGLAELLWVRQAWGLSPRGDVPPPADVMPVPVPSVENLRRDKGEWERAWIELWTARLGHVGKAQNHDLFEAVQAAPLGSVERRDLLDELMGPSWRTRFGNAGFDDGYQQWIRGLFDQNIAESRLSLHQHPERRCLDALIPAWERGLTTVVVVPCSGDYTRTLGSHGLCLTRAARLDPGRYARALRTFGR
jgi:hypothetical protein